MIGEKGRGRKIRQRKVIRELRENWREEEREKINKRL